MKAGALALVALAACSEHGKTPAFDGPGIDLDASSGHVTMLVLAPSAGVDFGSVPIGATSASVTVTVSANVEGSPQTVSPLLTGPAASSFVITGNQCLALMAPNTSCKLLLAFQPTTTGANTGQLAVTVGDASATLALSGLGAQTASLVLSPSVFDYGAVPVGTTTARAFTLTNSTGSDTGPLLVSLTGANPGDYGKGPDSCSGVRLMANATCTISIAFSPTSAGSKSGTLQVGTPAASTTASLLGSGVTAASALVIAPAPFDFGSVAQGNSSLAKMFTVTNIGNAITGSLAVTMAGSHPGDFLEQGDQCTGHSLGAGASCTLFVTFEPGPVGMRNARVQVAASPGGFTASDVSGTCTP